MKKGIIASLICVLMIVACNPLAIKADRPTPTILRSTFVTNSPSMSSTRIPGVAIYLASIDVKAEQLSDLDVRDIRIDSAPFLSMDDILAYSKETYELTLTTPACKKVQQLNVPVFGRPFVVYVGNEPIYSGAFWVSYSSQIFDRLVIDTTSGCWIQSTIRVQLGYPESLHLFKGKDNRSDLRILKALDNAGKLN
jgi:hypothetical protein